MLTLSVLLSYTVLRYAERWLRISRGRLPRGRGDFLRSLRGLDSKKGRPRKRPRVLNKEGLRVGVGWSACWRGG